MPNKETNNSLHKIEVVKFNGTDKSSKIEDQLAVEEPLQISVAYGLPDARQKMNVAITMRTPGADQLLCLGFLLTEGIINNYEEVTAINLDQFDENKITIHLSPDCNFDAQKLSRHLFTSSSCGVCGKTSIENLHSIIKYKAIKNQPTIQSTILYGLPKKLRTAQSLFEQTGGIHAAGLFTANGTLLNVEEDVGRHNALDKLLGWALKNKLIPLNDKLILVSGRSSFELVQKALMAGCFFMAAVGAPSSLAVDLARNYNTTLIGFLKDEKCNVYCGEEKIVSLAFK